MTSANIDTLRFDAEGLIPAIVQETRGGKILMLAYMNRESLAKTLETGETHFWSRKRNELWHKGATSGNTQSVTGISVDCDSDSLLVQVEQKGNACHTGEYSCFFNSLEGAEGAKASLGETLGRLAGVIAERAAEGPEGSYTAKLLKSGVDRILKKIGEEAGEVIIAAKNHQKQEIAWEVADLLYHTLVLLEHEGVSGSEIATELENRSKRKKP
jgi:phosphoribosyl-AMP cyclohydrolase / phosphoribosyl-ATP pyrophosphohydrolase